MKQTVLATAMLAALLSASTLAQALAQPRPAQQAPKTRVDLPPAPVETVPSPVKGGDVVARIGDSDVTADEIRSAISFLDQRQQTALAQDPALLSQTVRAILANRLALAEATAKKWDQQAGVQAQIARARESIIVESYLKSVTAPPDSYPSEAEIKTVYEANAAALLVPRRYQLSQILISVARDADKDADEAAQKKLSDVTKKLKAPGAEFGKLARTLSDDGATAEREGELGWLAEPDLRPEIRTQVIGLAKGGITEPVRLDDGWHIIKLVDTEASRTRSLAEVREALIQRMKAEKADANRRAYMNDIIKRSPPVVNEIALSKLLDDKATASSR
jgi:parvulin-like peptidyl-prolyl isomerase